MGEYATYGGKQIKMGTCEDMYYLRADQAHKVQPERGSVDPIRNRLGIRFRFPFPDEDKVQPGCFDPYDRGVALQGVKQPEGIEHYSVQFQARGYVMSIPCPESSAVQPYTIHRNGFAGSVILKQQKWFDGRLVIVCACGGCDALYRVETLQEAEAYIVAARSEADRRHDAKDFWHAIADRMAAGYAQSDSKLPRANR